MQIRKEATKMTAAMARFTTTITNKRRKIIGGGRPAGRGVKRPGGRRPKRKGAKPIFGRA